MLRDALKRDLEDLNIVVIDPERSRASTQTVDGVDPAVIEMILNHCPSATYETALERMKTHNNNISAVINIFNQRDFDPFVNL